MENKYRHKFNYNVCLAHKIVATKATKINCEFDR